jgi:hypothetical protein
MQHLAHSLAGLQDRDGTGRDGRENTPTCEAHKKEFPFLLASHHIQNTFHLSQWTFFLIFNFVVLGMKQSPTHVRQVLYH